MNRMGAWMLQCAYRFNCPMEIERMTFSQLHFWAEMDRIMTESERNANRK